MDCSSWTNIINIKWWRFWIVIIYNIRIDYDYFTSIAWNTGIHFLRIKDNDKAEKFMSLALKFLPKSKSLQSYNSDINELYSNVLNEKDKTRISI